MSDIPYHSASLPQVGAKPMQSCASGTVFVHDIMSSPQLPALYDEAGAIYVDLPWARGFKVFNERAGITDGRTFAQFIARVDEVARWAAVEDREVYIVSSDQAATKLSGRTYPIQLDRPGAGNVKAAVTVFNAPSPLERTTTGLLNRLAREWRVIGDFCCGYGTTVRAAINHHTDYVASDYSPEAIGYVCANLGKWK